MRASCAKYSFNRIHYAAQEKLHFIAFEVALWRLESSSVPSDNGLGDVSFRYLKEQNPYHLLRNSSLK